MLCCAVTGDYYQALKLHRDDDRYCSRDSNIPFTSKAQSEVSSGTAYFLLLFAREERL